ncbi:MFS transporter [Nocardia vermiculata]|uniref:MFS transporter n=1 Tax=Nocardia vermiculata TaxID=257274 RepID=A0A846Y7I7_9NOCA|nr:MFS transporter [Nocardia vermiculata]NKY54315.1 MFS transporter [Nocardia vermiculata]
MTTLPDPVDTADAAATPRRFRRRRAAWTILTILVLVEIISAFETSMVYAAIPTIIRDLHSDAGTVGWSVTAFLLVAAAAAAVCGRIGDMYGRERVLVVILAATIIGSLISALGDSIGALILGRAVQGVAGAILPLCVGLAREHLPREKIPVAVAVISGAAIAAGAAATYIAGLMIDHASWHMIFIVAAIYAACMLALVLFVLPWRPPTGSTQRIDYVGTLAFAPAIAAILLGINKISDWGFLDAKTLGLIVAGAVVLVLWVRWELRVDDPIINVRILTDRHLALTMLATVTLAAGPFGISTMINSLILQYPSDMPFGVGLSPTDAGLLTLIGAMFGFVFTPVSGWFARTVGARISLLIGVLVFGVYSVLILFVHHSTIGMFFAVVCASIAASFAYTALPNLIVESVDVENTSEVSGINAVIRTGGQGIGTSIAGAVLTATAVAGVSSFGGLQAVAAIMLVGTVLTLVLTLMIRRGSVYRNTTVSTQA